VKCIIAGSRTITLPSHVYEAMTTCPFVLDITEVVCGCAAGPDVIGRGWAKDHGVPFVEFPAGWRDRDGGYDPGAGFKRNGEMAEYADALVAVWDMKSKGTIDMVHRARQRDLQVHVHLVSGLHRIRRRW
jgi:hypothetical protein